MTNSIVVDTDVLSAILRRDPRILAREREYLDEHHHHTLSTITRYEVLRGLKAKGATRQQNAFERFCNVNIVLPLSDEAVSRAAEIYADLYRRGELIGDADILIAATALVGEYNLATNNERHFRRIGGLTMQNWLA